MSLGWPTGVNRLYWVCYVLVDGELYDIAELKDALDFLREKREQAFTGAEWDFLATIIANTDECPRSGGWCIKCGAYIV